MNRHNDILALIGYQEHPKVLLEVAKQEFRLDPRSVHGPDHWLRVYYNAIDSMIRLRGPDSASLHAIMLFALLHDCKRQGEGHDPLHGVRAAELLSNLHGTEKLPWVTNDQYMYAVIAIEDHSFGYMDVQRYGLDACGANTVRCCWDADRLDLPRVDIEVNPEKLLLKDNRNSKIIALATERAVKSAQPLKGVLE